MRLVFVSGPIENQIFIERRDVSGGRSRERGLLQIWPQTNKNRREEVGVHLAHALRAKEERRRG
jgi:hypothetical protein